MSSDQGKPDHWNLLASQLGAETPPQEPPEPADQPQKEEPEAKDEDYLASLPRSSYVPPPPKPRKTQADWANLASELGIEVPSEPEAEPAAPAGKEEVPVTFAEDLSPPFQALDTPSEIMSEMEDEQDLEPEQEEAAERAEQAELPESPESPAGPSEERRGRRRRRRRRPSRGEPSAASQEAIDEGVEQRDEEAEEAPDTEGAELPPALDGEETGTRRRRRRRRPSRRRDAEPGDERKRRGEETGKEAGLVPAGTPRDEREDHDEDDDEDEHDGASDKASHRAIPSWSEAVGIVVAANLESRAKTPDRRGPPRSRGRNQGSRDRD
jgi:ribonuclease E